MRETWYVLEDGTNADPVDVAPDGKGVLRHKNGMAVGIRPDGNPQSSGVDVEQERAKSAVAKKPKHAPKDRQVTSGKEPGADYETR